VGGALGWNGSLNVVSHWLASLLTGENDTKLCLVTTTYNMAAYTFNDAMIIIFISLSLYQLTVGEEARGPSDTSAVLSHLGAGEEFLRTGSSRVSAAEC